MDKRKVYSSYVPFGRRRTPDVLTAISGKSMIEMLAVLAIMGVLTILAVTGFKTALTSHQVNILTEDVKMAVFLAIDEKTGSFNEGSKISLDQLFYKQTDYRFSLLKETETTYAIIVENIPQAVCRKIRDRHFDWLEEIRIDNNNNTCQAINTMSFFFNADLSAEKQKDTYCVTDEDCGECGTCETRRCHFEEGEVKSGQACIPCDYNGTISNASQKSCDLCQNRFWQSIYSRCFSCEETTAQPYVSKDECLRCSNRYWPDFLDKNCYVCPENGVLNADRTRCDVSCNAGEFFNFNSAECQTCSDAKTYYLTQEECAKCPNNTRFWQSIYSRCFSCEETTAQPYVSKDECLRCSNRYYKNSECILCSGTVTSEGTDCIE